jgi:hypothetical protein
MVTVGGSVAAIGQRAPHLQVHPHLFRRQVLLPAAHAPVAVALDDQQFIGGRLGRRGIINNGSG